MEIREPIIPTDHLMVMEELREEGARRHHTYCKERDIWTIVAEKGRPVQAGYSHFSDLAKMAKKTSRKARTEEPWISDAIWRLED